MPNEYFDVAALEKTFQTPDKAQAFFVAGLNLNMRDDDPDYPALVFGNYMLGGGFLNSRLMARIRIKEGLSYGVGSQLKVDSLDKSGSFLAFAIYAPQNLARLEQAFKEEIDARARRKASPPKKSRRRNPAGNSRAAWRVRRTTHSSERWATTCSSAAPLPGTPSSRRK